MVAALSTLTGTPREIPTTREFHEPLLKGIGRATDLKLSALVPLAQITDDVMREAGLNPKTLSVDQMRSARRNITYAYRYLYRSDKVVIPLTIQGKYGKYGLTEEGIRQARGLLWKPKNYWPHLLRAMSQTTTSCRKVLSDVLRDADVDPVPLTLSRIRRAYYYLKARKQWMHSTARGQWGLSELGNYHAMDNRGENITSHWLGKHLTPEIGVNKSPLMKCLWLAVSRKCSISAGASKVEDHIQEFLLRMIRRNAFRKRILMGRPPSYSHVATYAVNSAFTDHRNAGTEPVERAHYSARTETERKVLKAQVKERHQEAYSMISVPNSPAVTYEQDSYGNLRVAQMVDPHDLQTDVTNRLDFEKVWAKVTSYLIKVSKSGELYARVLRMRADGVSLNQISKETHIPRQQVGGVIRNARRLAQRAGVVSQML